MFALATTQDAQEGMTTGPPRVIANAHFDTCASRSPAVQKVGIAWRPAAAHSASSPSTTRETTAPGARV